MLLLLSFCIQESEHQILKYREKSLQRKHIYDPVVYYKANYSFDGFQYDYVVMTITNDHDEVDYRNDYNKQVGELYDQDGQRICKNWEGMLIMMTGMMMV